MVALTDGKGVSIFVFFLHVLRGFWNVFILNVFFSLVFWDVLSLRETGGCSDGARRQREEGGGLVQYAAPAYRLPSTEIAYAAPPSPLTICRKLISIAINRKGNLLFYSS